MPGANLTVPVPPEDLEASKPIPPASLRDLREWFFFELEQTKSARHSVEAAWQDALRMYEAIPERATISVPIPDAPNLEVPIGATATDAIYAQSIDTIFQISPVISVRPTNTGKFVEHAKDLQRFVNWGIANEWGLRGAAMHTILDCDQLGTGIYYIPWVERSHKTLTQRVQTSAAPQIFSVPLEDFYVPGASPAQQDQLRWQAFTQRLTMPQLNVRAKRLDWNIEGVQAAGTPGFVRDQRERLARTQRSGEEMTAFYEIVEGYCSFDIDDDGIPEDLLVTGDITSRSLLRVVPNPFDQRWPFESMVYQPRAHMFYGIGVIEMLAAFEREVTLIHNARVLNMLLANARIWGGKIGVVNETMDVWPSKVIPLDDPSRDLVALQMADVYPSSERAEAIVLQYAERRSGINDLARGRAQQLGNRTPGITALTAIQAVNQRFAPAFDAKRLATAAAVRQCLYRYQERALMDDPAARRKFIRVLGEESGNRVFELMRSREFDDGFFVELTASSASINRDADRQNAIMLVNVLGQYYQKLLELVGIATNPQTPEPVRQVALKIVDAAAEAMDRTVRTFDLVRDPETFVVRLSDEFAKTGQAAGVTDSGIAQLMTAMAQGANGEEAPPGAPEGVLGL